MDEKVSMLLINGEGMHIFNVFQGLLEIPQDGEINKVNLN